MTVAAMIDRFRQVARRIGLIGARPLLFGAAAFLFVAATPSVAFAQQIGREEASRDADATISLVPMKPSAGVVSPKSWEWHTAWEWQEVCWEESGPGWTDRDWDTWTVCEWELVEVSVLVWVDDPPEPECPRSAPVEPKRFATAPFSKFKAAGSGSRYSPYRLIGWGSSRTYQPNPARRSAFVRLPMGTGWYLEWDRSVNVTNGGNRAHVTRGDGGELVFKRRANGSWESERQTPFALAELASSQPGGVRWVLTGPSLVEAFDDRGRLRHISREGNVFRLGYSTESESSALETVTDSLGGVVRFEYDSAGRIWKTVDPDGGITRFEYEGDLLVATYYPNGQWREFRYAPSGKLSQILHGQRGPKMGGLRAPPTNSPEGGAAPDLPVSPRVLGSKEMRAKNNCPAPCEPWMRTEIFHCIVVAEEAMRRRNLEICNPIIGAIGDLPPDQQGPIWDAYFSCTATSDAIFLIERARCTSRYPQCY